MIRVAELSYVGLGVPDLGTAEAFYTDIWGLQLVESEPSARYLRASQSGHHAVILEQSADNKLRRVAFTVRARADLDEAVSGAVSAGGSVVREPADAISPGHQASAALADPDGNVVELLWGEEHLGEEHRGSIVTPKKLGHVVLNTPDPASMEKFYASLGLRVSDRTARGMSFLRCNTDHHSLAFVKSPRTGLQHAAFDVEDIDNVMRALGVLTREGTPCIWGPGRHGPGRNIFTYYKDPAGHIIEYYADMEQVDEPDDGPLEEKFWGPEHKGDSWGLAGSAPFAFTSA